ncbi:MAG: glycosyltransferase family 2 protein [Nitrospirae bacterium]|nr:glycosyltransferase family 2 protein [Nitrospirota bacterium]
MLSIAIITHNEEGNIRDALESVRWAEEIVVIDANSSDRTQDICREYTDKVYSFEWAGFSAQKNKAVSLTTQPWVFVLDADERFTDALKEEVTGLLGGNPSMEGYYVSRKNYFAKKWIRHGGWWPDHTLRLFRREKGVFESREVHESVKVNGETGYLKNPIEHYTYKDIDDFLKRMQDYSTLSAKELYKKGRRANILDIVVRPVATFIRMYFLQLGMLDGFYGIILACLYSVYTFKKYSKLKKMWKQENV